MMSFTFAFEHGTKDSHVTFAINMFANIFIMRIFSSLI